MPDEIEDSKTERLIAAKRHNELKDLLAKLTVALGKKDDVKKDDSILKAIYQQTEALGELVKGVSNIPKPEKLEKTPAPQVNVEVDLKELSSSIESLNKKMDGFIRTQNDILEELRIMNMPKETTFLVQKNQYTGALEGAVATTKISKPKAQA